MNFLLSVSSGGDSSASILSLTNYEDVNDDGRFFTIWKERMGSVWVREGRSTPSAGYYMQSVFNKCFHLAHQICSGVTSIADCFGVLIIVMINKESERTPNQLGQIKI